MKHAIFGNDRGIQRSSTAMLELSDKLRSAASPFVGWRDTHYTADGMEATVTDPMTGQMALVTLSSINAGSCDGCGHISHSELARCAAVAKITKEPCACAVWAPRFPEPDAAEARA